MLYMYTVYPWTQNHDTHACMINSWCWTIAISSTEKPMISLKNRMIYDDMTYTDLITLYN